jgi:hypothetical protein
LRRPGRPSRRGRGFGQRALEIIRVPWQTGALHDYDDIDDSASAIPLSELGRRVTIADNGRFDDHLSKPVPQFVRKANGGYRLSGAGKRLPRTVATVAGEHDSRSPAR